jgi:hypothetical protein
METETYGEHCEVERIGTDGDVVTEEINRPGFCFFVK